MHNLAFRYSQAFNKRYCKIGHLFQGRYKAILLDKEGYFLKLLRYIHLNPVRANMVKNPLDYYWNSHSAYLGECEITWLTTTHALSMFDTVLGSARKLYNDYCLKKESQEELDELRKGFKDGQVLGDDNFTTTIREKCDQKTDSKAPLPLILQAACIVFNIDVSILSSTIQSRKVSLIRGAIAAQAVENGMKLKDVGIVFKRDESTISRLISRFLINYSLCENLKQQTQQLKETVYQLASLQA